MRKTYMMLLALVFSVLGATTAMAQKIYKAELDVSMFKAWDGFGANANVVENPEPIDDGQATFGCENNLYRQLEGGNVVFGNTNVYYLWYADITGTQRFYAEGTPGLQLRVLMNRPAPEEGGDAHGGAQIESMLTIGNDGKGYIDVSDLEFVHLNCIKVNWGGSGIVRNFYIEGTMKPVVGILSMINNGDAEGDDLSSFPVSYDGPNNGGTANDKPEIVSEGVDGSKCFKVTTFPEPSETWHTQFYIKADEVMPKGSKWKLSIAIKADREAAITTSAQGAPREWKGGFVDEFAVGTEWKKFEWSGEIGVDDFQSVAFDLNNLGGSAGNGGAVFYFDNIEFGYDLGGSNPMNSMVCEYNEDVIRISLNDMTNMKELVKNSKDGKTLIFPNDCATVTLNGQNSELVSVEGRPDGNLYLFLLDDSGDEGDDIVISFKNPADAEHHLTYVNGKWAGMDVPDFSGITCDQSYDISTSDYYSYVWGAPQILSCDPEQGSFNLPVDLKKFVITFNQEIEVKSVVAKLDGEVLIPSGEGELSKVITLTRSRTNELSGVKTLSITEAKGEKNTEDFEPVEINYSFGIISSTDKPELYYASNFTSEGEDADGAGWIVTADPQDGVQSMQPANSGAGNRLQHGQAGYAADVLYLAQRSANAGIALYGTEEDHKLSLKGGRTYQLTLKTAQWDAYENKRSLRVQVLTEDAVSTEDGTILDESGILAEDFKAVEGKVKEDKEFTSFTVPFTPENDGNYVIRLVSGNADGNPGGFGDGNAISDVRVSFIPDVMGIVETEALNTALENAKQTRENNSGERYAGAAWTALDNLIKEYDGKILTAPSVFAKATEDLNAAAKASNDHVTLCDNYDKLPAQAFDLYEANKDGKFKVTEYFTDLKAVVTKYCTIGTETQTTEEGEEYTAEVMTSFQLYYDDAELNAASTELSDVINMASKMFTDEKSSNVYGHVTTGYAALHERLRRGVALLKSLGVPEDAAEIVNAENELGDNDEFAEAIVKRASLEIFKDLASGESKLFEKIVDDISLEETTPSYDLSVFAKNPNIYGPAKSIEVPGWTKVEGNSYAWSSWDGAQNHSENSPYPEDCSIHAGWHPSAAVIAAQTIENLPAGIYRVKIQCSDNNNPVSDGTFGFVKTSETPEVEEGEEFDPEIHTAGYVTGDGEIEELEILDGKLTVGFRFGTGSQAFLNDVEIWLTSPIAGFDYSKNYQDVLAGIETAAKTAKVRGLELYDLNGRRITTARKGLVIVKKYMSDGTVKTEKVIK